MLRILFLFLLLSASVVLGPLLVGHQGRVVIETANNSIELSITSMVLLLITLLVVLFVFEWLIRQLFRAGSSTRGWFFGRRHNIANKQTKLALLKMIEGDYKLAEDLLTRNADYADQPVVNYLFAAEAAQRQNNLLNTNQYIERATELAGKNQLAVDITRIRIQLAHGAVDSARIGVDQLLNVAPRHPEVLNLAEKIYLQAGAYNDLLNVLPLVRRLSQHSDVEVDDLQLQAYLGLMKQAVTTKSGEGLKQWWESLPRKTRHNNALRAEVASLFIDCNDHEMAQQLVLNGLKQGYDERLVLLMPRLKPAQLDKLEQALWKLIKKHGATPLLNSTLGQILLQHGEWKSASEQFNYALAQRPDVQDYALLAETYDKLSHPEDAAKMREEGLRLTLKQHPES